MDTTRILIIDDEEGVRESLTDFLEGEGYEVFAAADGDTGLRLLAEIKPQMMFLDIYMPGWSGLDVIRRVRQTDPEIPVVMITAHENEEIARDLLLAGATDFIKKPWRLPYLKRVVEACLAKVRKRDLD